MFSCFFLQSNKWGACFDRLRGSNRTSTLEYSFLTKLIPDLDNANVGTFVCITGNFQIGGFPYFYFRRCNHGESKRKRIEYCREDSI